MSRYVFDHNEYETGAKWFAQWHRDQPDDNAKMIDLDSLGYCPTCLDPLYLIEATRGRNRKPAHVTEHLGRLIETVVWVVYQDKSGAHPGEILVHQRVPRDVNHGWLPENEVWQMLQALRAEHKCSEDRKAA